MTQKIDVELMGQLVSTLQKAAATYQQQGAGINNSLTHVWVSSAGPKKVTAAGSWVDTVLPDVQRRHSLAYAAVADMPDKLRPKTVQIPDDLGGYPTSAAAAAAGKAAAQNLYDDNADINPTAMQQLELHKNDPDYVKAFYDQLGPQGAYVLSIKLKQDGVPDGAPKTVQDSFATYTHTTKIDDAWIDKFCVIDGDAPYNQPRVDLLTSLINSGDNYDTTFLGTVSNRLLHPKNTDIVSFRRPQDWTTLLQALGNNTQASLNFMSDHQTWFYENYSLFNYSPGGHDSNAALARVLRVATVDGRALDPAKAEAEVVELLNQVHAHSDLTVLPEFATEFGAIQRSYFDDLVYSVTTTTPGALDHQDAGRPGVEVPPALWATFDQQAMADPKNAAAYAALVSKYILQGQKDIGDGQYEQGTDVRNNAVALRQFQNLLLYKFFNNDLAVARNTIVQDKDAWDQGVDDSIDTAWSLVTDPEGFAKDTVIDLAKSALGSVIKSIGSPDFDAQIAALDKSGIDFSAMAQWQVVAVQAWTGDTKPEPVTIVRDGQSFTYTGDPADYELSPDEKFWDDRTHAPIPVSRMTPVQLAAYQEWLQDPALVAAGFENVQTGG